MGISSLSRNGFAEKKQNFNSWVKNGVRVVRLKNCEQAREQEEMNQ